MACRCSQRGGRDGLAKLDGGDQRATKAGRQAAVAAVATGPNGGVWPGPGLRLDLGLGWLAGRSDVRSQGRGRFDVEEEVVVVAVVEGVVVGGWQR